MPVSPFEFSRVVLAILALLAPGFLARRHLYGRQTAPGAAGLLLSGLLGLAGLCLVFWAGARLQWSLDQAIVAWFGLAALGLILSLVRGRQSGAGRMELEADPGLVDAAHDRWLGRLVLLSAVVAIPFGTYISSGADSWEYLNRAAHILRTGQLNAGSPYDPALHQPYDPTFYGVLAAISRISGVEPAVVGSVVPVVATPLEIGAMALAAVWLTGSSLVGPVAALIYAVLYGPFFLFRNSLHHQMLADALFLLVLGSLALYLRTGRRRLLLVAALGAGASATLHHFLVVANAFTFGLIFVTLAIPGRGRRPEPGRPFAWTAAVAVGLLPMFAALLGEHLESIDPKAMDEYFRQVYAPLLHLGPTYVPHPFAWYLQRFWHPIPALLLLLHFRGRFRQPMVALLSALLAAPVLIVLNPLVFPLVAKAVGLQVATRILNLTNYPSVIMLGWVITEVWSGRLAGGSTEPLAPAFRRRGALLAALSIAIVLPQTLIRIQGDYFPGSIRREKSESPVAWRKALARLAREARPGQVAMSDPYTAYSLPTFAPLYIVANHRADFAFQTPDFAARSRAQNLVIDPLSPPDSTLRMLGEFQVDWLLLNRRFVNPLVFDKIEALANATAGLTRRFDVDGLEAWSIEPARFGPPPDAEAIRREILIPPQVFEAFLEPGTGVVYDRASGIGGVLGPDEAAPGDTLYITLYYDWRPQTPGANYYVKLMREAAYGSRWKWVQRQVRSAILGRADVMLFPRDLYYLEFRKRPLHPGDIFADQFRIEVPREAVPGTYALYVAPGRFPTEGVGLRLGQVRIVKEKAPPADRL